MTICTVYTDIKTTRFMAVHLVYTEFQTIRFLGNSVTAYTVYTYIKTTRFHDSPPGSLHTEFRTIGFSGNSVTAHTVYTYFKKNDFRVALRTVHAYLKTNIFRGNSGTVFTRSYRELLFQDDYIDSAELSCVTVRPVCTYFKTNRLPGTAIVYLVFRLRSSSRGILLQAIDAASFLLELPKPE